MDKFIIEGGRPLQGKIEVEGVKNAILPMMCASIMAGDGRTLIHNVPYLQDIKVLQKLLRELGAEVQYDQKYRTIEIDPSGVNKTVAPYELVKQMRASFLLSGALLGRFGECHISQPGGCAIGARPVNSHLEGFRKFGAVVTEKQGVLSATAKKLTGAVVCLDYPSHTGTENLMMIAVMAEGETIIENAACEPEVRDFGDFLNVMGAKVKGHGTSTIKIMGVKKLNSAEFSPITDRIVSGTYMCAAAITGGQIEIQGAIPADMLMVIEKLSKMGVEFENTGKNRMLVKGPKKLASVDITTLPHPGFPTDLQPLLMACMTVAEGVSLVRETVFENRFIHAAELSRMGAEIKVAGDKAVVAGVKRLSGVPVMASDIRAGAALVLAGLAAEGITVIDRIYHVDRGYEHLEQKLASLGGAVARRSG